MSPRASRVSSLISRLVAHSHSTSWKAQLRPESQHFLADVRNKLPCSERSRDSGGALNTARGAGIWSQSLDLSLSHWEKSTLASTQQSLKYDLAQLAALCDRDRAPTMYCSWKLEPTDMRGLACALFEPVTFVITCYVEQTAENENLPLPFTFLFFYSFMSLVSFPHNLALFILFIYLVVKAFLSVLNICSTKTSLLSFLPHLYILSVSNKLNKCVMSEWINEQC